ncbi:uncharacterized protein LOC124361134 [Homalodisca vitripennis]|uniref:uncharacterized protein LOC124361134 n=1 Tax=Homalodisca vitripennis TaxID=197043 RepID=UPI001EEACDF2|nr:uncharacterized protein LOC124361134 [Homalodisca vitripennis]
MSNHPSPRKRKVSNPDSYIRTKNKNARLKGQEYVSPSGKTVASKQPEFDCRCANQCLKKIGEDGCTQMFSKFYNLSSKNEQDLFLQGQVDAIEVQRRRPSTDTPPQRAQKTASFKYHVNKVPIKQAKIEDILKLKEYIPDVYSAFYNEVFQWLTTTNNQGPDSDYEIETDNEIEEH